MVRIEVFGGEISQEEKDAYVEYIQRKYHRKISELSINVLGDEVTLNWKSEPIKFERIRRITGYLTGTTDTWNDSKTAELNDRVKHSRLEKV
jgi:hypothetical protein